MSNATHTTTSFGAGLLQHRVTCGTLVASGLAPEGSSPVRWTVSRVLPGRGRRWTLPAMEPGQVRSMRKAECKKLAAVLKAVAAGRV